MKLNREAIILLAIYIVTMLLWVIFYLKDGPGGKFGYFFQIPLTILPLLGGIFGLIKAKVWGGLKSDFGKAITSISLGYISWSIGMFIWNYFIFFAKIEVPYPSTADFLFIFPYLVFWPYGVWQLSKVIGTKYAFRTMKGKVAITIYSLLAIGISYYLLIIVARGGSLDFSVNKFQLFFDLFYPLSDAVVLVFVTSAYALSRGVLGGIYKIPVELLFIGFIAQYIADFSFSYTTTTGTYYNGNFSDVTFFTSMFILSLAIAQMSYKKI
ncbi:hypothetical protein BH09PAT2_BH09PAT2_08590 [soil metagenome]